MLLIVNIVDEWESNYFVPIVLGCYGSLISSFEIAFGTLYIFGSRWFCLLVWVGCLCDLDPLIRDLLRANTLVVIQGESYEFPRFCYARNFEFMSLAVLLYSICMLGCMLTLWICDVGALTSDVLQLTTGCLFTSSLCYVVWIKCGFYLVAMAYGAFCVFYRTVGIYGVFIYMLFVLVDLLDGIALRQDSLAIGWLSSLFIRVCDAVIFVVKYFIKFFVLCYYLASAAVLWAMFVICSFMNCLYIRYFGFDSCFTCLDGVHCTALFVKELRDIVTLLVCIANKLGVSCLIAAGCCAVGIVFTVREWCVCCVVVDAGLRDFVMNMCIHGTVSSTYFCCLVCFICMLYYRYLLLFRLGWMRLIVLFCLKLQVMVWLCSFIVYLFYLTARDLIICLVFEPISCVFLLDAPCGHAFTLVMVVGLQAASRCAMVDFGRLVYVCVCKSTEGYAVVFGVGLLSFLRRWLVCYVYVKLGQLLREIVIYLLYVGSVVLVCFTRESCMRSSWRLMLLRELGFVGYIFLVIPVIKLVGCYVNYFLAIVGQVDFRVFCIIVNGGIGTCYAAGDLQV
eukprot:gene13194-9040_t